ncbi:putative bifunctional diguanylate cyclase/phosphodiesterase [Jidongwangia harbinensis]|uniref:putative bifunctional diguanylate cyclase/phosphodiesterase n=1 Tax=Jidongwangia harbinensis TaxID=2878561 RepID=UPI001CD91E77|nr:bifunctional diguanylate cyclase/phosphodiesterase [Jidongwangia harbinensis]MCA2217715.1 bifunctional diguanylate cyclase/phosphodiesterase [Jidongwangia harbinensis]
MTSVLAAPASSAGRGTPPGVRPADRRRGSAPAWLTLGAGGAALAAVAVGPSWLRLPATAAVIGAGLWALTYGIRRNAGKVRSGPWRALLAAAWCVVVAMVIRVAVPGANTTPPGPMVLLPDVFVLAGYLGTGYGFAAMLRRRRSAEDDPARVDALLVGVATAFLTWTYLIAPSVGRADFDAIRVAHAFFPVIDVVLLVLVAQLALAGGVQQPSLWLLIGASATMFAGDALYTLLDAELADVSQHTIDSLFLATFLLTGTAALHPSMRTLIEPQRVLLRSLSKARTAVIALVVVVPTVVTTVKPAESLLDGVVRAALCTLLVLAVLMRVVRAHNSRARAESATRRRATHDPLTDLPNRELLAETITSWGDRAAADSQEISLLFIDLDRFKMVNDHWGHQVGDELLCAVAARLGAQVRGEDLVCRIGGDEFVIALASPSHSKLAESLADRVLDEFLRPFDLSVGRVVISASIGVAKSFGGAQALELIRDADTAMYKAKGSGRNAYALFDTSLRDQVRDRVNLEQALRRALGNGELSVHFQPIVELEAGELDGFEALMRWHHPEFGNVTPLVFIPIAEETGLIVESGAWLLRESARQLAAWTAARPPDARQLHVSVNVSVRQLRDGALVDVVRDVLAETGLPPAALWLEITESGVMEDIDTALVTLHALRDLGVVLCIDDFGTGYSSLNYLHRLPVGIVKIDRGFVAGVGEDGTNEPIVRAVLAMTHAMGHRVVAEGVETEVQRDWLRAQGCDLAQGWLHGRPQPADQLADAVRAG